MLTSVLCDLFGVFVARNHPGAFPKAEAFNSVTLSFKQLSIPEDEFDKWLLLWATSSLVP